MTSGKKVAIVIGVAGAIAVLGVLLWRRVQSKVRGTPTQEQWDTFASMGDVNRDGYINNVDVGLLQAAYNSTPSSPNWNPTCDLNKDGKVDLNDATTLGSHVGLNIWDYFGL
jgi:hypothetical protein